MAAITICSDFGAQENKVCHCFHCFPIYLLKRWGKMGSEKLSCLSQATQLGGYGAEIQGKAGSPLIIDSTVEGRREGQREAAGPC